MGSEGDGDAVSAVVLPLMAEVAVPAVPRPGFEV